MQQEDEVFLSRVFTVPRTKRGKEYGRHFILKGGYAEKFNFDTP